jgi:hypothetical protein
MAPSPLVTTCPSLRELHLWWNISLDNDARLLWSRTSMMRRQLTPLMMRCDFWTIIHDLWLDVAPFYGDTWLLEHHTPLWRMTPCLFHSPSHTCDYLREFMIDV